MNSDGSDSGGGVNTNDDDLTLARVSLSLQEFSSAKMFADRALRSNLLPPADQILADQILAVAHVHIAASQSKKVIDNNLTIHDWYAILQLGDYNYNIFTEDSLSFAYRRLADLLQSAAKRLAYGSKALKLVVKAYSVLSDPQKRSLFDSQIRNASAKASKPSPLTFWTLCRTCFHVHQYERGHEGKELRCPICNKSFVAAELPVDPPIVEGTDMYHCTWGFFPIGFPDGYMFKGGKEEEKTGVAPDPALSPSSAAVRKRKQSARKTVRVFNFGMKLRSGGGVGDG